MATQFGIKQSKLGWKFTEQWLRKAKILGLADEQKTSMCIFKHVTNYSIYS